MISNSSREAIATIPLELTAEFADLEGILREELTALVSILTQRAHERLWLTRKEQSELRAKLWNRLADAVNETVEPLSAELR